MGTYNATHFQAMTVALLFKRGFRKSTPIVRRRLFQQLFSSIYLTPYGLEAFYKLSESNGPIGPKTDEGMEVGRKPASILNGVSYPNSFFKNGGFDLNLSAGSFRAEHGGQGRDRTADLRVMNPPLSPSELPGRVVYCL